MLMERKPERLIGPSFFGEDESVVGLVGKSVRVVVPTHFAEQEGLHLSEFASVSRGVREITLVRLRGVVDRRPCLLVERGFLNDTCDETGLGTQLRLRCVSVSLLGI